MLTLMNSNTQTVKCNANFNDFKHTVKSNANFNKFKHINS